MHVSVCMSIYVCVFLYLCMFVCMPAPSIMAAAVKRVLPGLRVIASGDIGDDLGEGKTVMLLDPVVGRGTALEAAIKARSNPRAQHTVTPSHSLSVMHFARVWAAFDCLKCMY